MIGTGEIIAALLAGIISLVVCQMQHLRTVGVLAERVTRLETKMDIFCSVIEKNLTSCVKSPRTKRIDELLDKLNTISSRELDELASALKDELDDEKLYGNRPLRIIFLTLMEANIKCRIVDGKRRKMNKTLK